jgi:outer membrane protein OmpA-like peptidoglycan-associated protein
MMTSRTGTLLLLATAMTVNGCKSLNRKDEGGLIGAAAGGAVGAAVGRANGSTARGAILGAAVGGAIGMIIGHQMDAQADKIKQRIPGATVERVGEGIQVTFASGLLFDFDSDVVRADAATNLRNLAQNLGEYPNSDLLIVGHTDSIGVVTYNQSLSERRAKATEDYLVAQGVTRSRLRATGRGEVEPVADNGSGDGQQRNRRVEIAIYANEQMKADARRGNP